MKKIMILGGGEFQIPLLKAAKKENLCVVLCDRSDSPKGKPYADRFYQVNTVDREGVLAVAKAEKIDGIISNSEPAMMTVAYVAETMHLPGNRCESIATLVSKDKFRTFQEKIGLFAPKHFASDNADEILRFAKSMQYPIILKPVESSGSRGTEVLYDYDEKRIRELFLINQNFSRNNMCSVEEYVEMPSLYVIDGDIFVYQDEILWNGMFTSIRSIESPMIPMIQVFPIMLDDDRLSKVKETLTKIFRELKIVHGEYNVEMYFDREDRLFVIEINARQGGNGIPFVIQNHCGIDMYKLLVTTSVGDASYFEKVKKSKHYARYISRYPVFSNYDGIYQGLHIDDSVKKYVTATEDEIPIGTKVNRRKNAESVICFVDLTFDSPQIQKEVCDHVEKMIYPIVISE